MTILTGLDKVVESTVQEMENKYNCLVFILYENRRFYMNVMYTDPLKTGGIEIPLAKLGDSKYTLATAIRRYFR